MLFATYDLFQPREFTAEEKAFFDELDRQRASVKLPPVIRVQGPNDRKVLNASAERIRKDESTPHDELQFLVDHFAQATQRDFRGMIFAPMRIEGWRPEFPKDLFEHEHLAAAAKISYFQPPGSAWGQHIVLLVFTKLDGPMQ